MTITLWDEVNNELYNQKEIYNATQETKEDSLTKPKCINPQSPDNFNCCGVLDTDPID